MSHLAAPEFKIGKYHCAGGKESILGRGSYATVYRATDVETGELVAIKVVDIALVSKKDRKSKEHLKLEISTLQKLQHPHIVRLLFVSDIEIMDDYLYMVFEFCGGGDMSKYIAQHRPLTEEVSKRFMTQLASGLKYLQSLNIIHRDLKPHNLLLTSSGEDAILKISDFGFARTFEEQAMVETVCGSPLYMAPEILKNQKYTAKADLWSVGVILFEMLTGKPPYTARSATELLSMIEQKEAFLPEHFNVSEECRSLLKGLLQRDPVVRITWTEFFTHRWIDLISHRRLDGSTMSIMSRSRSPSFGTSSTGSAFVDQGHRSDNAISPASSYDRLPVPSSAPAPARRRRNSLLGEPPLPYPYKTESQSHFPKYSSMDSKPKPLSFDPNSNQTNDARRQSKRIQAIASLAQQNLPQSHEIVLLLKALLLLRNLFSSGQHIGDPDLDAELRNQWSDYLRRVELEMVGLTTREVVSPEKIIYDEARQLAKEGALCELSGESAKSAKKYEQALLLFEQLFVETTHIRDKEILLKYMTTIEKKVSAYKLF